MTDQSIREAISWTEKELKKFENANNQCIRLLHTGEIAIDERDYLPIFITLAQQYLDAGEMIPDAMDIETEITAAYKFYEKSGDLRKCFQDLGESIRSQCLLILVKKEEEIKELEIKLNSIVGGEE